MQSIKELNLKANHNCLIIVFQQRLTVCNLSKNSIWKQITTKDANGIEQIRLYAIYQRTQSESKSQPTLWTYAGTLDCMQSIKELNLKANHNYYQRRVGVGGNCMQSIKELNLKANHNCPTHTMPCSITVCNLSKNSIWKQITTTAYDWSR